MNVPIKSKNDVAIPPSGYVFAFIDSNDMQLKAKLSNGTVVNYTSIDEDVKVMSLTDYTAFEVMPNKVAINPGTVDKDTGLTYSISVPACTEHKFTLRSVQEPEDCDVVIDWGDGTVESIKEGNFVSHSSGKSYELSHDYSSKMNGDIQRFIVKIYGKDYYTFRNNSYVTTSKDKYSIPSIVSSSYNLISRIFDKDLPIASHVSNFASMCYGAMRLLKVNVPHSTKYITSGFNFSSTFQYCQNLKVVEGFEDNPIPCNSFVGNIFAYCLNLEKTDFVIPTSTNTIGYIFYYCENLTSDISKLIPSNGFAVDNVRSELAFAKTTKLTGSIPSKLLWDSNKTFVKCSSAFRDSSLKNQAPVSWGGTADDSIIEPSLEERIKALEEAMSNTLALDK